jgi:hypothetical protein
LQLCILANAFRIIISESISLGSAMNDAAIPIYLYETQARHLQFSGLLNGMVMSIRILWALYRWPDSPPIIQPKYRIEALSRQAEDATPLPRVTVAGPSAFLSPVRAFSPLKRQTQLSSPTRSTQTGDSAPLSADQRAGLLSPDIAVPRGIVLSKYQVDERECVPLEGDSMELHAHSDSRRAAATPIVALHAHTGLSSNAPTPAAVLTQLTSPRSSIGNRDHAADADARAVLQSHPQLPRVRELTVTPLPQARQVEQQRPPSRLAPLHPPSQSAGSASDHEGARAGVEQTDERSE